MMSSSSAMSAPPHPEAAEQQAAAIDERHPQVERAANEEIADQRQRNDGKADRHERLSDPQSGDGVDQHEVNRPERSHLARREMTEPDAGENSKRDEQQECRKHPEVEGADAGARPV